MAARLFSVVVDADDHVALARWWAAALETPVVAEEEDEAWLEPPGSPEINFVVGTEPKTTKNRIHLDLATYSTEEHLQLVERLLDAGATRVDLGQRDVDWVVLADPEGNEFCVLAPRPAQHYDGRLASIVFHTNDAVAVGRFWTVASGWRPVDSEPGWTALRAPSGKGPYLEIAEGGGVKLAKNRIHLDVAGFADDDQAAEVERLVAAGARRIDIGQGDVSWVVLADPAGNEFCVLTSR